MTMTMRKSVLLQWFSLILQLLRFAFKRLFFFSLAVIFGIYHLFIPYFKSVLWFYTGFGDTGVTKFCFNLKRLFVFRD